MVSAADTMDLKVSMLSNGKETVSSTSSAATGGGGSSSAAICFASACKQNENVLHVDVTAT